MVDSKTFRIFAEQTKLKRMKLTRQQIVALFYLALSLLWIIPFVTLAIRNGVLMTPAAKTNKVVTYDTVSKTDSTITLKIRK